MSRRRLNRKNRVKVHFHIKKEEEFKIQLFQLFET